MLNVLLKKSSHRIFPCTYRRPTSHSISVVIPKKNLHQLAVLSGNTGKVTLNSETAVRSFSNMATLEGTPALNQVELMLTDQVILVDRFDHPIGSCSKKESHHKNQKGGLPLHRAFSVISVAQCPSGSSQVKTLITQRAATKITFPHLWTNTCCSHPLFVPGEMGKTRYDAVRKQGTLDGSSATTEQQDCSVTEPLLEEIEGAKLAVKRKAVQELGMEMSTEDLVFLCRVHYMADDPTNDIWGEHEMDYVFLHFYKQNNETEIDFNPEEVSCIKWVTFEETRGWIKDRPQDFTPWFSFIFHSILLPLSLQCETDSTISTWRKTAETTSRQHAKIIHRLGHNQLELEHWIPHKTS
eukprot:GHVQ01023586.1.p1 GENE.GHVQ01023586.1~~GHVQ01023586.1.p1  ORF type:complete len:354 (-),score=24.07 GHVQ01023586.1:68-1129(-)